MNATYTGRFAPSPTGPLHLGSLATALGSYLDAKIHQGQWLLRIEDIDQARCKPAFANDIVSALNAHGLHADGDIGFQSKRQAAYQHTLGQLTRLGLVFPCACTRKTIEKANTGREFGAHRIYPGTCRQGLAQGLKTRAIRFHCPAHPLQWTDHRLGRFTEHLAHTSGDFVLQRGDGFWAYHLVVVVDDIQSNITHIVRGEDLVKTTARQVALYNALGATPPSYWHLPVILAQDGQKLSKQTGAQALNIDTPIDNLNKVWRHFGMPAMTTKHLRTWLQTALPMWKNYRQQQKY